MRFQYLHTHSDVKKATSKHQCVFVQICVCACVPVDMCRGLEDKRQGLMAVAIEMIYTPVCLCILWYTYVYI